MSISYCPGGGIKALSSAIASEFEFAAKQRCILGDRMVAEVQVRDLMAEDRIRGIKAKIDHDLKILVVKVIGIDKDLLVISDYLFFQAVGRRSRWF